MTGYRVLPLDQVPAAEVVALLRLVLGEGPLGRTEATFRWKHREGPFGPSWGVAAVADDGTLAGVRLFQRWRLAAGGAELAAARAVDTATHPQWRRRGVFRRLTLALAEQLRAEGVALIFNTPNPESRAGYLAMGWRSLGRVPLLVRPRRTARLFGALLRRRGGEPGRVATPRRPAATEPVSGLLDEPALDRFLAGLGDHVPRLHTPRSGRYLRWRYGELPAARTADGEPSGYGALWRLEGDGGAAVIARARERGGLLEVALCELLVGSGGGGGERGERVAAELVDKIVRGSGADYLVAIAARGTPERRALAAAGFLPAGRRGPHLVVRELTTPPPPVEPDRWPGWRLSVGDLELF